MKKQPILQNKRPSVLFHQNDSRIKHAIYSRTVHLRLSACFLSNGFAITCHQYKHLLFCCYQSFPNWINRLENKFILTPQANYSHQIFRSTASQVAIPVQIICKQSTFSTGIHSWQMLSEQGSPPATQLTGLKAVTQCD